MIRDDRIKLPWDYSPPIEDMERPVPNLPTPEGRELGREMARLARVEHQRQGGEEPCHDCAFREGTDPNGCAPTLMDAIKCAFEREPFYCHVREGKLCTGWRLMVGRRKK